MKVLAMTVCCVDVYPGTGSVYVGGNSLNFAVQCTKSGAEKTAVLGAVGNDRYGRLVRDYLKSKPVDLSHLHVREGRTASNTIYINENNDRYFLHDSWDGGVYAEYRLTADDIAFINTFDCVATTFHDPNIDLTLKNRKNFRLTLDYLDTRDFDRIERLVPQADISFISGDIETLERAKHLSAKYGALIVVTLGAGGSRAFFNGTEHAAKAVPVDEIVDTTGCGDAYQAAFTVSYLQGADIETAMMRGSETAAKVLGHFGGVD